MVVSCAFWTDAWRTKGNAPAPHDVSFHMQVTVALCRDSSLAAEQAWRQRSGGGAEGLGASQRLELELAGVCLQIDLFGTQEQHARRVALSVHHLEVTSRFQAVSLQNGWRLELHLQCRYSGVLLQKDSIG